MTTREDTGPETISDSDLDTATGGGNLLQTVNNTPSLKTQTFIFDNDGKLVNKATLLSSLGTVNTARSGESGNGTFAFGEDIDDDFVPTTFRVE